MSDYTQIVDYSVKDALSSGDAAKKILGSEIDAELAAIATAIASKLDSSGDTDLAVADGGTGASTAADARTNLGLGTMATQSAAAVAITGGSVAGITDLAVADGGTGASTAANARTNLGLGALATLASVNQGTIDNASVGQGELKTALNTISVSANTDGASVLSGGRYCFMPAGTLGAGTGVDELSWIAGGVIYDSGAGATPRAPLADSGPTAVNFTSGYTTRGAEVTLLSYRFTGDDASNIYVQYVAACPPYNLGNGDIPTFTFGLMNKTTGHVDVLWDAEDPPWANNGPTQINPLGRLRRLVAGSVRSPDTRSAHLAACRKIKQLLLSKDPDVQRQVSAFLHAEATQEEKQRDMPLIPHPFASNLAGHTVVLLDPCSKTVEDLWLAQKYGGDYIADVVNGGYLEIGNAPCGAISPPGVMAVSCRWKNTP